MKNSTRDLIRREIAGVKQRLRGVVLTEPRAVNLDSSGIRFPQFVVDVDIGRNRVLEAVVVKLNAAGSRSYARPGCPVWLEKDAQRYQVVSPADRAVTQASVVELDEDAGTSSPGGSVGFRFVREPFSYYKGAALPTSFYDPGADAAVRCWLRAYDRVLGAPANIAPVTDTAAAQVVSLTDKSGHGHNPTQNTAAQRPLYRRFESTGGNSNTLCVVDFDGTDDRMPFPGPVTEASPGAISIFALCGRDNVGSGDDVLLELNHWRILSRRAGGNTWGVDQGGGVSDSGSTLSTSFVLIEVVASSFGSFDLLQNGTLLGTFTPGGAGLALGTSTFGGSASLGHHDGRIAELLVLDGAVTPTKRAAIEAYFNQAMFVAYSLWSNGVDGFPKIRVFDADGNEVPL